MLGYFPRILPMNVVEKSHRALEKWVEEYGPNPPKDDIRHPEDTDLEELFKGRYGLVHIGTWDAQGHPFDDPYISHDTLTTSSTKFSHTYQFLRDLAMLTTELSIIFAAFNCTAWSEGRRIVNSLSHLLSVPNIARTCDYEAWTTRAILCNLFTHVHRNFRDEVFGYAAIAVFGSFTEGDFVVPQLKLKFPFRPGGDVIFVKGHMLEHFVTPWQPEGHGSGRFSVVHFNHHAVVDWVNTKLEPSPE